FYSLQGEGFHSGRPAVFVRFSGCNLWSGREEDRGNAICKFCDTDFIGTEAPGGVFSNPYDVVSRVNFIWPKNSECHPFVICTGGEPLLQLDQALLNAFHKAGFEVAIETNGTIEPPNGIDWICVSPKAESTLVVTKGNELKLVFPQEGIDPEEYTHLEFDHFALQPMDNTELDKNTRKAWNYCLDHPRWTLSLQIHKILGIP
ncbi:MAG: 7-carboxy-7-deazaguanine synthase, partial [Chloroflexi bacterium]|nr:7-carboxy-7-deazaguanine synthase [Chloroflexota bacterium]